MENVETNESPRIKEKDDFEINEEVYNKDNDVLPDDGDENIEIKNIEYNSDNNSEKENYRYVPLKDLPKK